MSKDVEELKNSADGFVKRHYLTIIVVCSVLISLGILISVV